MADIERRNRRSPRRWRSPFTRFFEDFMTDLESEMPEAADWLGRSRFVPAMDVSETEDEVTVTAELQGVTKDDLDITVHQGVLTIRGEKKHEEEEEGEKGYHRLERRYGRFEKSVSLPDYVDEDNIDATYTDGVLKVTMPKTERARPRTVEIKEE